MLLYAFPSGGTCGNSEMLSAMPVNCPRRAAGHLGSSRAPVEGEPGTPQWALACHLGQALSCPGALVAGPEMEQEGACRWAAVQTRLRLRKLWAWGLAHGGVSTRADNGGDAYGTRGICVPQAEASGGSSPACRGCTQRTGPSLPWCSGVRRGSGSSCSQPDPAGPAP